MTRHFAIYGAHFHTTKLVELLKWHGPDFGCSCTYIPPAYFNVVFATLHPHTKKRCKYQRHARVTKHRDCECRATCKYLLRHLSCICLGSFFRGELWVHQKTTSEHFLFDFLLPRCENQSTRKATITVYYNNKYTFRFKGEMQLIIRKYVKYKLKMHPGFAFAKCDNWLPFKSAVRKEGGGNHGGGSN